MRTFLEFPNFLSFMVLKNVYFNFNIKLGVGTLLVSQFDALFLPHILPYFESLSLRLIFLSANIYAIHPQVRKELDQQREQLAADRKGLEMEQRQLRDQRGVAMEKLRARVKELEAEVATKAAETERLKQRLVVVEQENSKLKAERNRRKDQQQAAGGAPTEATADELRRLRSSLQLVEAERDQLERTVQDLRAEMAARRDAQSGNGSSRSDNSRGGEEARIRHLEAVVGRLQEQLEASHAAVVGHVTPVEAPVSPRVERPASHNEDSSNRSNMKVKLLFD